jgi:hypothetical protein
MLVDEVAGSTIHRKPDEGPGEAHSGLCCFRKTHDRITGRKGIVHVPA